MRPRALPAYTLMELMVVLFIIGFLILAITSIIMQGSKLYASTSVHIEPQASAMLGLKRMERELRDTMKIVTGTPSPTTWIELKLPEKDENGLNKVYFDSEHRLALVEGKSITYFLGTKGTKDTSGPYLYYATPSADGSTLFRAEGHYDNTATTIPKSRIIVDNIVNPTWLANMMNDTAFRKAHPELTREDLKKCLFVFTPFNPNGTPDDLTDDTPTIQTELITISFIVKAMFQGKPIYHPLWTEFKLRNLH